LFQFGFSAPALRNVDAHLQNGGRAIQVSEGIVVSIDQTSVAEDDLAMVGSPVWSGKKVSQGTHGSLRHGEL